jgi:integrase/recombinase XerD
MSRRVYKPIVSVPAAPVVTIFVRHSADCPHEGGGGFSKRCKCRKSLRFFHNGKQQTISAKTRSWAEAEKAKRKLEDQFKAADPNEPLSSISVQAESRPTIDRAVELYLSDKLTQGLDPTAYKKHVRELGRFAEFMGKRGKFFPHEIGHTDLTEFRATWAHLYPSSLTRSKVQERLRGFLRYAFHAKMIDQMPVLSTIKVTEPPTLPLTDAQYAKLLEVIPTEFKSSDRVKRMHALVRLMRFSGLAIQDAVTMERTELVTDTRKNVYRVVTSRQKTGVHVSVPIPDDVAEEVKAVMTLNGNPEYIFWNRIEGKKKAAVDVWERAFKRAFTAAGMPSGHSHQLRDTFAVGLLQQGVPLEEVSKLLGHTSIKTTEKSYAPWVQRRQDRLDTLVMDTFAKAEHGEKAKKGKHRG